MRRRAPGRQAVHHLRRVLDRVGVALDVLAPGELLAQGFVLAEVVRRDPDVVAYRDAQPLHLRRPVEVPGHVLAGVLGGLRRVEAQPAVHVDPHAAAELGVGIDPLVQQRVQALPGTLPSQQPGLVVHARAEELHFAERHADQLAQVVHRPVHGVAHAGDLHARSDAGQVLDVHRHRVRVAQQPGIGRDRGHCRPRFGRVPGTCATRGRCRRRRACRRSSG